jgi:hypothetical protein
MGNVRGLHRCTKAWEEFENATFVKELRDDKNKVESKYSSLIGDVNKHMDVTAAGNNVT